jgi:hypothetical protein
LLWDKHKYFIKEEHMKRKLFSSLAGCVLAFALLVGFAMPFASASGATVEVLNPLASLEPQYNQPLTSRDRFKNEQGEIDFSGKYIGLSAYGKVGNAQAIAALGELLKAEFPGATIVAAPAVPALGSPWNNKSDANYDKWAGVTTVNVPGAGDVHLDAVIFGVAD